METKRTLWLKGSIITLFLIMLVIPAKAQDLDTLQNMPNLLLPKFTRGMVKLKGGRVNSAILNYDLVGQRMVFLQRKLTLVLDDPNEVDTIFLANRIFIPAEKGFYEILLQAPLTLYKQNKSYVESLGTPTLYGARSQTTGPSYVQQIYGARGAIDLTIPKNYKVVDDSEYWIRQNGELSHFSTKRQFLKNYPDKQKDLKQYIKKSKTDFSDTKQVVALVTYLNELYR